MKKKLLILFSNLIILSAQAQSPASGIVQGKVTDGLTNQKLPLVSVTITGLTQETITDSTGTYILKDLEPGIYNIQFSHIGYQDRTVFDVQVAGAHSTILDVNLETLVDTLQEVRVFAPVLRKSIESPISMHNIGGTEIKRNPGGNRDISKVIQSFPGVNTSVTFRNDIIIRGGAPNENRFYIDGVEIPNINHFVTQGASGGPVGLINVDFIREVDFYSGAFPANRGNTLSSVLEFRQRDGRDDHFVTSITAGSSDLAAATEGPLGKRTTMITSYRYSYLQGLFKLLDIPFLPAYQDFQFKIKTKFNANHELTLLGLGAWDDFQLYLGATPTDLNTYIINNVPVSNQHNYTFGANYKNYHTKGYSTVILSTNYLYNTAYKYEDNNPTKIKTLDYTAQEIEYKLRFENTSREGSYKINYGAGAETAQYLSNTDNRLPFGNKTYQSDFSFVKYGVFTQLSRSFAEDKLSVSLGLRADANTYSANMNNLAKTISPRLSASYNLSKALSLNFYTGIYYQLPAYTVLGYRPFTGGPLLNQQVDFIRSNQIALGLEYNTPQNTHFTVESFYKMYSQYPIVHIFNNDIPLANLGANYGVVGNNLVTGTTKGRSYGIEFLAQQRLNKGFYGIMSVTLFNSEFQDKNQNYVQSSWNSRYIVSITGGKLLPKNWEIGFKFRLSGGSPYTPYDMAASSLKTNFIIYPQGIPDFNQLNQDLLANFYQIDFRIDKKYSLHRFSFNWYIDIQNLTYKRYQLQPILILDVDASGNPQNAPSDPNSFKTKLIENISGAIIPTVGAIFEF